MNLNFDNYIDFYENDIKGRYITNSKILSLLNKYNPKVAGYSVLNNPIYSLSIGRGPVKILIWSQMHGNESTSTKAIFDCLSYLHKIDSTLLSLFKLKIIPILNPDGANAYSRTNHNNIDLNRDSVNLSQPESILLRELYNDFKPDFCFNMHDQRTIYSLDNNKSSIISFLAPSADLEKTETEARTKSMSVISYVYTKMNNIIPGNIGRYNDDFNINCVGDSFQSFNTPTILFESGHILQDYQREISRKFVCFSLIYALEFISQNNFSSYKEYYNIPENRTQLCDIKISNIKQKELSKYKTTDLSIMYYESFNSSKEIIEFIPEIKEYGNFLNMSGHLELDFSSVNKTFDFNNPNIISEIMYHVNKLRNIH